MRSCVEDGADRGLSSHIRFPALACEVFFGEGMDVDVAMLPEGCDPDDLLNTGVENCPSAVKRQMRGAESNQRAEQRSASAPRYGIETIRPETIDTARCRDHDPAQLPGADSEHLGGRQRGGSRTPSPPPAT